MAMWEYPWKGGIMAKKKKKKDKKKNKKKGKKKR